MKQPSLNMDGLKMDKNKMKAIVSLQGILKVDSRNEFVKRKIAQLTSQNQTKQIISVEEAYFLALMDKYDPSKSVAYQTGWLVMNDK